MARAETSLSSDRREAGGIHEQDPRDWWSAVCRLAGRIAESLRKQNLLHQLVGISVTSTSGSLVLVDGAGQPLLPGILYDDTRAASIAEEINRASSNKSTPVNASFSLAKAAWVMKNRPRIWDQVRYVLHPADWISSKLTGEFGVTDATNALKLGYESEFGQWGECVHKASLSPELLPKVVQPGDQVGVISTEAASATELPAGIPVFAGSTDGIASLIASGASQEGHLNTTLGTTIVWKALVAKKPAVKGGVYLHRHPNGLWAPGSASNTGPGCLQIKNPNLSPAEADNKAIRYLPSPYICYLLPDKGERFPFSNPLAETFVDGNPAQPDESYAAQLQSLAFVERWGYETLEEQDISTTGPIYSAGGAARSRVFSQVRSDVLNRVVIQSSEPTASFGAAILAATGLRYGGDFSMAIERMTSARHSYTPNPGLVERYGETYARFMNACSQRGYATV